VPVYPGYVCAIAGSIVAGVPVKWVENRSENLMSTVRARRYVMHAEMCAKDARSTGLRVDVIADHGAFDSTAQPTRVPGRLLPHRLRVVRPPGGARQVKAVYTNKAPGGVAYRCSFRITEAVYLVERMVDALALELKADPIELRMRSFINRSSSRIRRPRAGRTTPEITPRRCAWRWRSPVTRIYGASRRRSARGG
jgi:carbon-monoxide dehydrogenase large subunit